ncbi:MAG: hypothetical protein HXY40_00315 [Chloroflexi bacterium]|nr:hypothetical protein [Chloroflexota bacterium]
MIRLLNLPEWARPDNPVLRYVLGSQPPITRRARMVRFFLLTLAGIVLIFFGYMLATNMFQVPPGQHATDTLLNILFWPTIIIQVIVSIGALGLTASAISEEQRRQTWDSLRSTRSGITLALRARWIAVFYRMRGLLALLMLVRVILIVGILVDLTAFRGGYLDRIINNITPDVDSVVGVVLLSFWMSAALLLPIVALGFDAALGLLISTFAQGRGASVITQVVLALLRLAVVGALLLLMAQFLQNGLTAPAGTPLTQPLDWLLTAAYAVFGDWGLYFLEMENNGTMWATVPYGILIGVVMLAACFVLALLTDLLIAWAVRRAERVG